MAYQHKGKSIFQDIRKRGKTIIKPIFKYRRNIIVSLIILLAVTILMVPSVFAYTNLQTTPLSTEADITTTVTVTALDSNGNVVIVPPITQSAFRIAPDVYISSIKVDVTWVADGVGVDWSTFAFDGGIRFSYLNQYDNWISESFFAINSIEQSGSATNIFVLGVDICKAINILDGGWFIQGELIGTATAFDEIGQPLVSVLSGQGGTLNIIWDADLNIVGTWNWFNT